MNNRPDFDDFDPEENAGILESAGLTDYNNIQTKLSAEGAKVYLNCRQCNRPKEVVVEWPELAAIAANAPGAAPVMPPSWNYSPNNGSAYIALRCPNCHGENSVAVHMTPDEARKHVQAGINANFVNTTFVQSIANQVNHVRARQVR